MKKIKMNLQFFAEGGEGAGATGGEPTLTGFENNSGETDSAADYQEEGEGDGIEEPTTPDPKERKKAFNDLIKGEYKDLFGEHVQSIIDKRFKQTKQTEEHLGAAMSVLQEVADRYGVEATDLNGLANALRNDTMYLENEADERGLTVEQLMQLKQAERENRELRQWQQQQQMREQADRQYAQWLQEGEQLKGLYPDFDLNAECMDTNFLSMIRNGIPLKHAYETIHLDDIKANIAQQAEKKTVNNIQKRAARPTENGTKALQAGNINLPDFSKMSARQMEEWGKQNLR